MKKSIVRKMLLGGLVFGLLLSGCVSGRPGPEERSLPGSSGSQGSWDDVHGAGSQRSDPKSGSPSEFASSGAGYFNKTAPQGDAVRIKNYVRLVRDTAGSGTYNIVETGQTEFYDNSAELRTAPVLPADKFYGQDAQYTGNQPAYSISPDGLTVTDTVTGLNWMRGPKSKLSSPAAGDKMSYEDAKAYVKKMNSLAYGGYSDWRLPSIKELYSLILFSGVDVSGYEKKDTGGLIPFIDSTVFNFAYGNTSAGERIIDSQYLSSTVYAAAGKETLYFGVNFADGRIKGYGAKLFGKDKTFFVQLVRGSESYGINMFKDNGDGTVTDTATSLMWQKNDSGRGMDWETALVWVQEKNKENYLGYSDWRLPNAKELQSLVDYSHAPGFDGKPAVDTNFFICSSLKNEENETDYPWYWTGTTHANWSQKAGGSYAVYVAFGRAMGYESAGGMPPPAGGQRGGGSMMGQPQRR